MVDSSVHIPSLITNYSSNFITFHNDMCVFSTASGNIILRYEDPNFIDELIRIALGQCERHELCE